MLNKLWPIFIIVSFVYGIFTGRVEQMSNSIFESTANAVQLSITFLGTICLWNGMMEIVRKTSLMEKLTHLLRPAIGFLFPELKHNEKAKEEITLNMIANILGLGNAATPLGLKAMKTMQKDNPKKDTVSHSMAMFIVINTASIQIIPTTVIAIRASLGSNNPSYVIFPIWIATIGAAGVAILVTKCFIRREERKKR